MSWRSPLQLAQLQRLIPTLEQQAAALQEQLVGEWGGKARMGLTKIEAV
jgi:hypothetical protein